MSAESRAWTFGDDVDTDQIIAARHLVTTDQVALGRHCLEVAHATFGAQRLPGDVIVAGKNFGCGSSREHAPLAILGAGIAAVVAVSFARIFFRNAVNVGLPVLECPDAVAGIRQGDRVHVTPENGGIEDLDRKLRWQARPLPEIARRIIDAGGLMNLVAARTGLTPNDGAPS